MSRPRLSILTLTYNHRDYIADLHDSLVATAGNLDWEWLIGDAGDDGTAELLASLRDRRIRVLAVDNECFARNNNRLAAEASADLLVFVNNDVRLLPAWWQGLLACFDHDDTGVAGSRIVNEDGSFQSLGMGLDAQLESLSYDYEPDRFGGCDGTLRQRFYVPAVTGACMMVRRDVFERLGGFDTAFVGGYYEDTDFCLRVLAAGFRVMVNGRSAVIHRGKGSLDVSAAFWRHIPANRRLFALRWSAVIRRLTSLTPRLAKRILPGVSVTCTNRWLTILGGGEHEFLHTVTLLAKHSRSVVVRYESDRRAAGLRQAIAERFGLHLPKNVRLCPGVPTKVRTGVLWEQNYYEMEKTVATAALYFKRIMFGRQDAVPAKHPQFLFNSEFTRRCLLQVKTGAVVYPPVKSIVAPQRLSSVIRQKQPIVLSVGRFAQRRPYLNWKNQPALIRFFHSLAAELDQYRFVLAGGGDDRDFFEQCASLARSGKASDRIVLLADVARDELVSYYERSRFYVSFCGYEAETPANCEHFGMALVEAMSAGCVCFAYDDGGHREIIDHDLNGYLWGNVDSLRQQLIKLTLETGTRHAESLAEGAHRKAQSFAPVFFDMQIEHILGAGRRYRATA